MKRVLYSIKFIGLFLLEFLKANAQVAYTVITVKRSEIQSHLVEYKVEDLTHNQILILSQVITLTPGTIVAKIDAERKLLTIHILNARDPDRVLRGIDQGMKRVLLEATQ